MPFHWLEELHKGGDAAFDTYFALLDEFRSCKRVILERSRGPYRPSFKVGMENSQVPQSPDALILGQYRPSAVYFWGELRGDNIVRHFPFGRSLTAVRRAASKWWGVSRESWEKTSPSPR